MTSYLFHYRKEHFSEIKKIFFIISGLSFCEIQKIPESSFKGVCMMTRNIYLIVSAMLKAKVYLKVYMFRYKELKSPGCLEFNVLNVMNRHSFFLSFFTFIYSQKYFSYVQINTMIIYFD